MRLSERYEFVNGEIRRILTPEEVTFKRRADEVLTHWAGVMSMLAKS